MVAQPPPPPKNLIQWAPDFAMSLPRTNSLVKDVPLKNPKLFICLGLFLFTALVSLAPAVATTSQSQSPYALTAAQSQSSPPCKLIPHVFKYIPYRGSVRLIIYVPANCGLIEKVEHQIKYDGQNWGNWTDARAEFVGVLPIVNKDTSVYETVYSQKVNNDGQIRVRGVNAAGPGPASESKNFWYNFLPRPDAPSGLTATSGHGSVVLSWDAPPASQQVEGWLYRYKSGSGSYHRNSFRPLRSSGLVSPNPPSPNFDWVQTPGPSGRRRTYLPGSDTHYDAVTINLGIADGSVNSTEITGLSNNTSYTFQVMAVSSREDAVYWAVDRVYSPWSAEVTATPGRLAPKAPFDLVAEGGVQNVLLSWKAPSSFIEKWQYQQKTGDQDFGNWIDLPISASTHNYRVTGLDNNKAYSFRVRAVNSIGAGVASFIVEATPKPLSELVPCQIEITRYISGYSTQNYELTIPANCRPITKFEIDTTASQKWSGGVEINRIIIAFEHSNKGVVTKLNLNIQDDLNADGLGNGERLIRVRAVNDHGSGPFSNTVNYWVWVGKPEIPTGLTATPSDKAAILSWNAQPNQRIDAWDYRVNRDDRNIHSISLVDPTTVRVGGLTNDVAYVFQIRATRGFESTSWSSAVTVTPTSVSSIPTNSPPCKIALANVLAVGSDIEYYVQIPSNCGPITNFQYQLRSEAQGWGDVSWANVKVWDGSSVELLSNSASLINYPKLFYARPSKDAGRMHIRVRAVNANGSGTASEPVSVWVGRPAAPNVRAVAGDEKVILQWDAQLGQEVRYYQIWYQIASSATYELPVYDQVVDRRPNAPDPNPDWSRLSPNPFGSATSTEVTGLANEVPYRFVVIPVGYKNFGLPSNAVTATPTVPEPPAVPKQKPPKPTGVLAVAGDQQITLYWSGTAGDFYEYQHKIGENPYGDWTLIFSSASRHTVNGLTNGTVNKFRIRAERDGLYSDASDEVAATPAVQTAPCKIETRDVVAKGAGSFAFKLTIPANCGQITEYQYQAKTADQGWGDVFWDAVSSPSLLEFFPNSGTVTNPAAEETVFLLGSRGRHDIRVRALNGNAAGPESDIESVWIGEPNAPSGLTATAGNRSVTLSWNAQPGEQVKSWRYRKKSTGPYGGASIVQGNGTTTATVSGLDNGTAYTFQLRAVGLGFSQWSQFVKATPGNVWVTVSKSELAVVEGQTGTYTVVLQNRPQGSVTVSPTSADVEAVRVSGALTFTTDNWATAQTVTVTGVPDSDNDDETVEVRHAVSGHSVVDSADSVSVKVEDSDRIELIVSPRTLTVTEGGEATYTVALSNKPASVPTVTTVIPTTGTKIVIVSGALSFTTSNWSTAQTVTVSGVEDADGADETESIVHFIHGAELKIETTNTVFVTVKDNDAGISLSDSELVVVEGDSTEYTVKLAAQPASNVTVSVAGATGELTVSGAPLTFNTGNWDAAQTVTVAAGEDEDGTDDTVTLTNSAGSEYGSVSADILVKVTEDKAVTVSVPATLTVNESAGSVTVSVTAGKAFGERVVFNVIYGGVARGAANPGAGDDYGNALTKLTFDRGDTSRDVSIPIIDDGLDEGDSESFTVTVAPAAMTLPVGFALGNATTTVTITDDDASPRLAEIANVNLRLGEDVDITAVATDADKNDAVSYAWMRKSGETAPAIPDGTALNQARLMFTPPQAGTYTMTVTALDGNGNSDREEVTITVIEAVQVSVPTELSVVEGVGSAIVPVTVGEAFGKRVTFSVSYGDSTATGNTDPSQGDYDNDAVTSLVFGKRKVTKNIRIPINDDKLDEADETFTVRVSAAGELPAGFMLGNATTTVTIADDDESPVLEEIENVTLRAGQSVDIAASATDGDGDDITYAWTRQARETIPAMPDGTLLNQARLRFTPTQAGTYTMTVTASDEHGNSDTEQVVITVNKKATVSVPLTLTVTEAAGSAVVTVTTSVGFGRSLTFAVSYGDSSDSAGGPDSGGDYGDAVSKLTFSGSDLTRTISIPITDDDVDEEDETFTVKLSLTEGDSLPDNFRLGNMTTTVTVKDDDMAGVTVSESDLTMAEG